MIAELVSTGTELLLGQIVNTNAQYLAEKLAAMGIDVYFMTTVGDNRGRMAEVLRLALNRADIVITTGGLGPTLGDITKEVTTEVLGRKLYLHEPSLREIESFFQRRGLPMTENNIRQAMMPEGAIVLANRRGTAPGVILEEGKKTVINLPGPPRELEAMFTESVVPYLQSRYGLQGVIHSRVLRTFGIGEAALEERIRDLLLKQRNPTIALLARQGEIHIRITAKAGSQEEARQFIAATEAEITQRLGPAIFGRDDETLEQVVGKLLVANNHTIALAESCTGGLVTDKLTDVPGSSRYVLAGIAAYSNAAKATVLRVPAQTLSQYGAVSEPTARSMAEGVRLITGADLGIAVTGIAGPGGGTAAKPVGLVYIALAAENGTVCKEYIFTGERRFIKLRTALAALDMVRRYYLNAI